MENSLASYVRWTGSERHPDTPAISLELRGPEKLWLGTPYLFEVTLRRVDSENKQPCLFPWSPQIHGFAGSCLMLLHHTSDGLEKIDIKIPTSALCPPNIWVSEESALIEHVHDHPTHWVDIFPDRYLSFLEPGERYTLLWPGGLYNTWAWGAKKDHLNGWLPIQKTNLVLPGGVMISFMAEEGEKPPSVSDGWLMEISSRADEAVPILTARIDCPSTALLQKEYIPVTMHITYHAGPFHQNRPITFHIRCLRYPELYQWRGLWEQVVIEGCSWGIWDEPDMQISPGDHEDFATLYPGETWSSFVRHTLPDDAQVGDLFRCQFDSVEIDWWNWGTREDHKSTKLTVPCWIGPRILEPSDNDGRPLVVVPAPSTTTFKLRSTYPKNKENEEIDSITGE